MVTVPPPGMASRALTTRLMMALPSCASSACTVHRSGSRSTFRLMPSPTSRRSICASSPITSLSASTLGCMVCLRLKARSWLTSDGGAQRVLMDLVDFLERGIARLMAHQKEFAIADDDGEKIVEVVRHAAGELAHGLHLLRLGEFGLQRLLFGDVHQIEHDLPLAGMGLANSSAMRSSPLADLGRAVPPPSGRSRPRRRWRSGERPGRGRRPPPGRRNSVPPARPARQRSGQSAALASVMLPPASAKATPMGASRNRSPIFSACAGAAERHGQAARSQRRGRRLAAARSSTGCGEVLAARRGREPPGGLPVRQRADGGDDLQPRHHHKGFLARAAFGGIARQAIEHGGAGLARQRQFRRRRRFVFA